MIKVTLKHIRACGYCSKGVRAFCRQHGIDWSVFLREGFDIEDLRKIDDAMAQRVVAEAERG